jgi:hypothetical protein
MAIPRPTPSRAGCFDVEDTHYEWTASGEAHDAFIRNCTYVQVKESDTDHRVILSIPNDWLSALNTMDELDAFFINRVTEFIRGWSEREDVPPGEWSPIITY